MRASIATQNTKIINCRIRGGGLGADSWEFCAEDGFQKDNLAMTIRCPVDKGTAAAVRETGKQIYSPVDQRLSTASGRVITPFRDPR